MKKLSTVVLTTVILPHLDLPLEGVKGGCVHAGGIQQETFYLCDNTGAVLVDKDGYKLTYKHE